MNDSTRAQIKAYSYLRFSTPEQMKGDSYRRQTTMAEAYALERGLCLDDQLTFNDLGVSAYRGKNAKAGKLAEFLEAVELGIVSPGSYLLIEALDRLTRLDPLDALDVLRGTMRGGITVVTLNDRKEYNEESIRANPMDLMLAIMLFIRGNEESETKSRRLKAAWAGKREKAMDKPLTAACPAWLRLDKEAGKFVVLEERAAIVRRIFDMRLSGEGQHRIAETLNREGVAPFGRGKHWHRSYIKKLSENPAVVGTLISHEETYVEGKLVRNPLEPLEGYYPAVVDDDTYQRVNASRVGTSMAVNRAGKPALANLLAGLARCPQCEGTMTRVNKSSVKKGGKPQFVCAAAKVGAGCTYKSVRQENVEGALLRNVMQWAVDVPSSDADLERELFEVEANLEAVNEAIYNLAEAIAGGQSMTLNRKLGEVEAEKEHLEQKRRELWERASVSAGPMLKRRLAELRDVLLTDPLDKPRANVLLRQVLSSVTIDYTTGTLVLEWKSGAVSEVIYAWVG